MATEQESRDGTRKRLLRLHDGQLIESVLMPYSDNRRTACISSQVVRDILTTYYLLLTTYYYYLLLTTYTYYLLLTVEAKAAMNRRTPDPRTPIPKP